MLAEITDRLKRRLDEPLPGVEGQLLLSPRPRRGWVPGHVPEDARPGAALVLVYPRHGRPHLVLTLRDGGLPNHAGQVSLPGGAAEPGEKLVDAALREAHEEIGIDPSAVRVLGMLTPLHIPVSGFVLHPFVGVTDREPRFRPEIGEVARVLEAALEELTDPARLVVERRTYKGTDYEVPFLHVAGESVWGATAMILAEFLALLDYRADPWKKGTDLLSAYRRVREERE